MTYEVLTDAHHAHENRISSSAAVFRLYKGHESSRGGGVLTGAAPWPFLLSVCIFSLCLVCVCSVCVCGHAMPQIINNISLLSCI